MAFEWKRCIALVAAGIAAGMLAACGSSSVESAISPQRFVAFGDGSADVGQTLIGGESRRYSINGIDARRNWTEQVAYSYGKSITAAVAGGYSYAQGNALVTGIDAALLADDFPDAPTLAEQIDQFIADGNQFDANDLVLISVGVSDVIAQAQAAFAGTISRDQAGANARVAGEALSAQVQRLIDAGAKYIVVAGVYGLAHTDRTTDYRGSPWSESLGEADFLGGLSSQFNQGFKIAAVNKAENALYIDFEQYVNYIYSSPGSFGFSTVATPVCNSVDAGNGIGIGTGQVNSALCDTGTLVNSSYDGYAFADGVHLGPYAHRQFGEWTYDKIRERW